jgi:thiosulfate/3-mercaptopyruvate sulfurtransferase
MSFHLPCVVLLLVAPGADPKSDEYARPELLTEAASLAKLDPVKTRILDARPKAEYEAGHIPGAVWVDQTAWSKLFNTDQDAATWQKQLGTLGIDVTTPVVVYDNDRSRSAARIWWILHFWDVKNVSLLNGGWTAWKGDGAGLEVSTETPKVTAVTPKLEAVSKRLTKADELLGAIKKKSEPQIIDARSAKEYCGDEKFAARGGAIPGAINLEWSDLLDKDTQRFKSAAEIAKLFKKAGIDPMKPTVTYCQSGGRASVMAFGMELMGAKDVSNYYRSWAEWGNDSKWPVAKP